MSNLYYPDLQMATLKKTPTWLTEEARYETGFVQRNRVRSRPLYTFELAYEILTVAQYESLLNFFHQHAGMFEAFWFRDYTDLTPVGRTFATADGASLRYKLPHDAMDSAAIYVNGIGVAPTVDLATGVVTFAVAPAAASVLSYSATVVRYRARFGNDDLVSQRHKFIAYGGEVTLLQVAIGDYDF